MVAKDVSFEGGNETVIRFRERELIAALYIYMIKDDAFHITKG